MKNITLIGLILMLLGCSNITEKPTVKSILLEQLKNTHTEKDWFVPTTIAVEGLTSDQADWKDSTNNLSIRELVSHLIFWNERILIAFNGDTLPAFDDDNEVTFNKPKDKDWAYSLSRLDSIQTAWENAVEKATDEQLTKWSTSIANICTHNSYHTGQIVYIRKTNGWWDESKGVK